MLVTEIWNGNGGQAATASESTVTDAGYGIRDGNGGQGATVRKSTLTDAGHGIRDGNGAKPATLIECKCSYVS